VAGKVTRDVSERTKELLLAEYRYLADSFWRNEEGGEKRVNFFITLVTAVLAALVALATRQGSLTGGQISGIAFAACLGLLAVGILTFRRLIRRNHVTDSYKDAMDGVRTRFREWDPRDLGDYEPFPPRVGGARSFGRGGLTDMVAVVNSVIAAAAFASLAALSDSIVAIAVVTAVGFTVVLAAHAAYLEHSYQGTWLHPLWKRLPWPRWKPREIESSLAVISEAPEDALREIERLDEIAGHSLAPVRPERIRDRYFDTPDGRLAERRIALRVRELNGRVLVALKGPSEAGRWGVESRLELEQGWSEEAWTKVRAELLRRGIHVDAVSGSSTPAEALGAAGLEVVQDRTAERRVRDVLPSGGGEARVAELALDTVTYHLPGRDVRHYEVEIEAKARHGSEAVAAVATALVDCYWPRLRPWRHGKLPTGRAVAALLGESRARDLVGRDGVLKPPAYDALAEALGPGVATTARRDTRARSKPAPRD
jgi:hypothetical protein